MTDDEALIKQQIEQTREDLGEKVEALRDKAEEIRGKADLRSRGKEKLRGWQAGFVAGAQRFRQDFADPHRAGDGGHAVRVAPDDGAALAVDAPMQPAALPADTAALETSVPPPPSAGQRGHRARPAPGARLRELGEAGVAAGWRRKVADGVAPRVAESAPLSRGEVRAALGLVFLAMSGSFVLKSVTTALRRRNRGVEHQAYAAARPRGVRYRSAYPASRGDRYPRRHRAPTTPGRRAAAGLLSAPLAGVNKGWRKAAADRVAPRLAARTPLRDEHARATLGAVFLSLSTYYVIGSVRRFRSGPLPPQADLPPP